MRSPTGCAPRPIASPCAVAAPRIASLGFPCQQKSRHGQRRRLPCRYTPRRPSRATCERRFADWLRLLRTRPHAFPRSRVCPQASRCRECPQRAPTVLAYNPAPFRTLSEAGPHGHAKAQLWPRQIPHPRPQRPHQNHCESRHKFLPPGMIMAGSLLLSRPGRQSMPKCRSPQPRPHARLPCSPRECLTANDRWRERE